MQHAGNASAADESIDTMRSRRDRARYDEAIRQSVGAEVGRILRGAGHFQPAVDALVRHTARAQTRAKSQCGSSRVLLQ